MACAMLRAAGACAGERGGYCRGDVGQRAGALMPGRALGRVLAAGLARIVPTLAVERWPPSAVACRRRLPLASCSLPRAAAFAEGIAVRRRQRQGASSRSLFCILLLLLQKQQQQRVRLQPRCCVDNKLDHLALFSLFPASLTLASCRTALAPRIPRTGTSAARAGRGATSPCPRVLACGRPESWRCAGTHAHLSYFIAFGTNGQQAACIAT